jgi:N-acetylneuraminic acid mutarotase
MRSKNVIPGVRTGRAWRIGVPAALVAASMLAVPALASTPNAWTPAHALGIGRFLHVAALLHNGDVLVAGGDGTAVGLNSTEIYNPATGMWNGGGNMSTPRTAAAAVTLPSGKVLVVGGNLSSTSLIGLNTGEVYDPATNTWTPVANTMSSARGSRPVATLLLNGKVLVAGGSDAVGAPVATADIYDPATNTFAPAHAMSIARQVAIGTLLPSGKVLVAGGEDSSLTPVASAEVYNPGTDSWTLVSNSMSSPRAGEGIAVLPSGKVLLAGGESAASLGTTTASTDIYDPSTNTFSPAPAMSVSRVLFGMTSLSDGRVLAAGGGTGSGALLSVTGQSEVYDPGTNHWSQTGLAPSLAGLTTTLLQNGEVLAAGGTTDFHTGSAQAALFTPTAKPGAPVAVSASSRDRSALVTFAPPLNDGGLSIRQYTITASTGQTATTAAGRTFATVNGLKNGRRVTFTVTATNALGTGPASAVSNAVTPMGPDIAPRVRVSGLPRKLKLKRFLKGVKFSVTPSKAASLQISLLATASGATISRAFNLTLAGKSLRRSARRRTLKLVPSKKLVGHPHKAKVELVIIATDAAGSRSTTAKLIIVSG